MNLTEKYGKGIEFSIKTIAVITLGIMVVVLLYTSFDQFFGSTVDQFTGNIDYPNPSP